MKNNKKNNKIVDKLLMGAVIGGAIGSVVGAAALKKKKDEENKSIGNEGEEKNVRKKGVLKSLVGLIIRRSRRKKLKKGALEMKKIPSEKF